jgi:hypothetical protein
VPSARWRRPAALFAAAEKDKLAPLPAQPFVLAQWSRGKVGPDIHVKVGKTLYSVPWKLIGKTLDARSTATMVQLFDGGELVKTHVRKAAGKQTDLADYPPEKIAFHMRTPSWCRRQAAGIDPACAEPISGLLLTTPCIGCGPPRRRPRRHRAAAQVRPELLGQLRCRRGRQTRQGGVEVAQVTRDQRMLQHIVHGSSRAISPRRRPPPDHRHRPERRPPPP